MEKQYIDNIIDLKLNYISLDMCIIRIFSDTSNRYQK